MALSKYEEQILSSIVVASENDPNKPEFPPSNRQKQPRTKVRGVFLSILRNALRFWDT